MCTNLIRATPFRREFKHLLQEHYILNVIANRQLFKDPFF
jgi:hypothetical protein